MKGFHEDLEKGLGVGNISLSWEENGLVNDASAIVSGRK